MDYSSHVVKKKAFTLCIGDLSNGQNMLTVSVKCCWESLARPCSLISLIPMRRSRVSFVRMTSLWQRDKGTPSGQSIHSYYVCRQPYFLLNNNVSSDAKVYDNWKPSQWLDLQVQCQGRALRSHLGIRFNSTWKLIGRINFNFLLSAA